MEVRYGRCHSHGGFTGGKCHTDSQSSDKMLGSGIKDVPYGESDKFATIASPISFISMQMYSGHSSPVHTIKFITQQNDESNGYFISAAKNDRFISAW